MRARACALCTVACIGSAADVLFLVDQDLAGLGDDDVIHHRLVRLGLNVDRVDDDAFASEQLAGRDLVLLSSTVNLSGLGTQLRSTDLPIVTWNTNAFMELGLVAGDTGVAASQTELRILQGQHPMADGMPEGLNAVTFLPSDFAWMEPVSDATIIASLAANTNRALVVEVEPGDALEGGAAQGYRFALYLQHETAFAWTEEGEAQFDAVIRHALRIAAPEPGPPPLRPAAVRRLLKPVEPLGPSSRGTALTISEIMYHPRGLNGLPLPLEFIEICNTDPFTVSLAGMRLAGEIRYAFPDGVALAPFERVVVAQDPVALFAETGLSGILGPWEGRLANEGGELRLESAEGAVLLRVVYDDRAPWPAAADGGGASLELERPSYGENDVRAWGASRDVGGSPGSAPGEASAPQDFLRINEVLAHTDLPAVDYVEILNLHTQSVSIAGLVLTDRAESNRFVFAEGEELIPGGYRVLTADTLGFHLSSRGEKLFLIQTGLVDRVLDAMAWPAQENGVAFGRLPNGLGNPRALASPTPGSPNTAPFLSAIVFNEIMYHPLEGGRDLEYIELHNQGGETIDLVDWRIEGGVAFRFPSDSLIPPGGFAVVGRDIDQLRARYGTLTVANSWGNYTGSLSNAGDTLVLVRPDDPLFPEQDLVEVDRVRYWDGGCWPKAADGGGHSLELRDPAADNLNPSVWAASEEAGKTGWMQFEASGVLDDLSDLNVDPDELQLILMERGECLVRAVELVDSNGISLLPAGLFSTNSSPWKAAGNHQESRVRDWDGSNVLHLVASGDGDNGANSVECDLAGVVSEGDSVTLRVTARWLSGMPRLLLRLRGNMFELSCRLPTPDQPGSPGATNHVAVSNVGPCIDLRATSPLLPVAGEDVVVEAWVRDVDGVGTVALHYREEEGSFMSVVMNDDGLLPDLHAGDGLYAAAIPGFGRDELLEYFVEASDAAVAAATARYPAEQNALLRFDHGLQTGLFHTVSLWMTRDSLREWTERSVLSHASLPGTLVLGDYRVIHNSGARYRGSPFIRRNYTGPTDFDPYTAYVIRVPDDDAYLGAAAINLDSLEQPDRDPSLQRERMAFWLGKQAGLPVPHQRYVRMMVNGARRGALYADTQQPSRSFLRQVFPGNTDGPFYEMDNWFEFNDSETHLLAGNRNARFEAYVDGDGERAIRRYRWSFERKDAAGILTDDVSGLYELVDLFQDPGASNYVQRVRESLSLDNWIGPIALRRAVCDWDGYGYARGKNNYLYRPTGLDWHLLTWDLDFSLGGGSRPFDHPVFEEVDDPTLQALLATPRFQREYLRQLLVFAHAMDEARFNPVSDELYAAFAQDGLGVDAPADLQSWVAQRRAFLLAQIAALDAPFAITTNGGSDFISATSPIVLEGTAPFEAENLLVNGVATEVVWTGSNTWAVTLPLAAGDNVLLLGANDEAGDVLSGLQESITVEYIGPGGVPDYPVRFTELMYHAPEGKEYDFLELKNVGESSVDLAGVRVTDNGDSFYTFSSGDLLPAGGHLVLAADASALSTLHPTLVIHGELPFNLSNGGETITLLDPLNATITEVQYADVTPWPPEADGLGYSLVPLLADPVGDQNDPGQWTFSCALGGSPGEDDPGAPLRHPVWVVQPVDQSTNLGASVTFQVSANACPDASYQWWRDGEPVEQGTGEGLLLSGLDALDHESQFWCIAWNDLGAVTSSVATLRVDYPPGSTPLPPLHVEFGTESGVLSLNWLSHSNGVYRVQCSPLLSPADWRNLGPARNGDGSWFALQITNSVMQRAFYRTLHYPQP